MIDYTKIFKTFYPGKMWAISGEEYDGIVWYDDSPKPTKEELDALWPQTQESIAKTNCKDQAKKLIAATDWATLPDVGLKNAADYVTYRGILRGLIITPVADPVWPTEPTPIWE